MPRNSRKSNEGQQVFNIMTQGLIDYLRMNTNTSVHTNREISAYLNVGRETIRSVLK